MNTTRSEVLQFVQENDVKFIRLAFCDIFGTLKNIAIMSSELPRAFEHGISFDASAVQGFMNIEESDLLLFPDPSTITVLPWRPQQGRVARFFCDIRHPDGRPFEGDGRTVLGHAIERAAQLGYTCKIGSECEFYLFELDADGNPTLCPQDHAGYLDVSPMDRGENVRREICLSLEEMGIAPESSHHEQGPGQNEIDFHYGDALAAADNLASFKSVVKAVALQNGLFASFLPKPLKNVSGSGLHINMSLFRDGANIFRTDGVTHCRDAESFIAGILRRVCEITVFLNPLTNSYHRFGSFEAPKYVTWSHQNRSPLIRIPAAKGEYSRMELRSADPACNPYFAFALLIFAGLEGIRDGLPLGEPSNFDLLQVDLSGRRKELEKLPETLGAAVELARQSAFLRSVLPETTIDKYLDSKLAQWREYSIAEDRELFERNTYFEII
ncbi:glutamine synthetase family protein [Feifania hominis]|uniref:Glutamine synthetase n=1 Tax=Feifania hominis TaxID=2763660 RepID=A0A926DFS4_9FIRM|nr:glutamine synthetase family protein [Feifania hominis]MBC8536220.1 glutamine synthetase [Feifania hominis]